MKQQTQCTANETEQTSPEHKFGRQITFVQPTFCFAAVLLPLAKDTFLRFPEFFCSGFL